MKKEYAREAKGPDENHLQGGLSKRFMASMQSLFRSAPSQHVGMFAGSLLPYDSGVQPKKPN